MTQRRSRAELGRFGEDQAAAWYRERGFAVIEQNWFCPTEHGRGELDLIVSNGSLVVICEVKTRSSARFGTGHEAVGWTKQRQIRKLAMIWMHERRQTSSGRVGELRFDVAEVDAAGNVRVFEQAF